MKSLAISKQIAINILVLFVATPCHSFVFNTAAGPHKPSLIKTTCQIQNCGAAATILRMSTIEDGIDSLGLEDVRTELQACGITGERLLEMVLQEATKKAEGKRRSNQKIPMQQQFHQSFVGGRDYSVPSSSATAAATSVAAPNFLHRESSKSTDTSTHFIAPTTASLNNGEKLSSWSAQYQQDGGSRGGAAMSPEEQVQKLQKLQEEYHEEKMRHEMEMEEQQRLEEDRRWKEQQRKMQAQRMQGGILHGDMMEQQRLSEIELQRKKEAQVQQNLQEAAAERQRQRDLEDERKRLEAQQERLEREKLNAAVADLKYQQEHLKAEKARLESDIKLFENQMKEQRRLEALERDRLSQQIEEQHRFMQQLRDETKIEQERLVREVQEQERRKQEQVAAAEAKARAEHEAAEKKRLETQQKKLDDTLERERQAASADLHAEYERHTNAAKQREEEARDRRENEVRQAIAEQQRLAVEAKKAEVERIGRMRHHTEQKPMIQKIMEKGEAQWKEGRLDDASTQRVMMEQAEDEDFIMACQAEKEKKQWEAMKREQNEREADAKKYVDGVIAEKKKEMERLMQEEDSRMAQEEEFMHQQLTEAQQTEDEAFRKSKKVYPMRKEQPRAGCAMNDPAHRDVDNRSVQLCDSACTDVIDAETVESSARPKENPHFDDILHEEVEHCKTLSTQELRQELIERGISVFGLLERQEFILALAKARNEEGYFEYKDVELLTDDWRGPHWQGANEYGQQRQTQKKKASNGKMGDERVEPFIPYFSDSLGPNSFEWSHSN